VPVVPVYVEGGFTMQPKGRIVPRHGTMRVHFGVPIPAAGLTYEERDRLLGETRAAIVAMGARE
jgi:1-acyl-sn-glycerol-3-phosphate acyltransferase